MPHFRLVLLFFACLGNVDTQAQNEQAVLDDDPEMTLEQILVENWNASAESVRSSHLRLTVYRKLFDGMSFDVPLFVRELRIALEDSQLERFLDDQFRRLYAGAGRSHNPYWGYTAEVWHRQNATRTLWHDQNAERIGETVFGPHGVATRIEELNQIQLTNGSSTERLVFKEVVFLPVFKNVDRIKTVERSEVDSSFLGLVPDLDKWLIVKSIHNSHTLVVDPETGFVVAVRHQRGKKVRIRFNFGPVEVQRIGMHRPSVFCKISFDENSKPTFLEVAAIEVCDVNINIPDDKCFLAVPENSTVLDLRNGIENARVYSPTNAWPSVFEFVRIANPADNGNSAHEGKDDSKVDEGDGTDNLGDLSRVFPPLTNRMIKGHTHRANGISRASTIVVLFCVLVAAQFVRFFPFRIFFRS